MLRFVKADGFLLCGSLCVMAYLARPLPHGDPSWPSLPGMRQSVTVITILISIGIIVVTMITIIDIARRPVISLPRIHA
jgi:hypothetical protein